MSATEHCQPSQCSGYQSESPIATVTAAQLAEPLPHSHSKQPIILLDSSSCDPPLYGPGSTLRCTIMKVPESTLN
ncbi:hypothetical protein COCVIDRAFT_98448 [Bipolaris victoriae FI3]|uniref:Uncharacterized protein n=1 Tax=Bipolaris victoriae (strain FI3) TaxID=930091 RepID=W7ETV3_BIPV3|nr:hypothetical protein COCVIDRAFT_98448 [Bipolaris victoriae FI3]